MRTLSTILGTLSSAALLATVGCTTIHEQVKTARSLETVDTAPAEAGKGYVEFSSVSKDAVVPIYLLDAQHRPHLLAATGVRQGDRYSHRRHPTIAAEKVRVALPAGTHQFMIQGDGPVVQVPVEAGKTTPVEIDHVLIYRGDSFSTYRLDYQIFQPGAPSREERKS